MSASLILLNYPDSNIIGLDLNLKNRVTDLEADETVRAPSRKLLS